MPQLVVVSSSLNWSAQSGAGAGGFKPFNSISGFTPGDASLQITHSDPGGDDYITFNANPGQSLNIPGSATITRYRVYWRQQRAVQPCQTHSSAVYTTWGGTNFKFVLSGNDITTGYLSPNEANEQKGYKVPTTDPFFRNITTTCYSYNLNCFIDSNIYDINIDRFTGFDTPAHWNTLSNYVASFSVPFDDLDIFLDNTNFIGAPTDTNCTCTNPTRPPPCNCTGVTAPSSVDALFVIDYETIAPGGPPWFPRRRYNVSFLDILSDVTAESTTVQTATTTSEITEITTPSTTPPE
jgi:hypothetical protein